MGKNIRFVFPLLVLLIAIPCTAQGDIYLPAVMSNPVKFMAMGDSIVGGGFWVTELHDDYNSQCGFEFVGRIPATEDDPARTGYGGATTINYLDNEWHKTMTAVHQPDIVALMLGTNDYASYYPVAEKSAGRVQQIIDDIHEAKPDVVVYTFIIGRTSADLTAYDAALQSLTGVIYVDQFGEFDPAAMTYDGVHPNEAGSQFMADTFYEALVMSGYCGGI